MVDLTQEQRAALEKAATALAVWHLSSHDDEAPEVWTVHWEGARKIIALYLAETGREAEAESLRRARDA